MLKSRIIGIGSALGGTEVSNEELSRRLPITSEEIESRTGIKRRFICDPAKENIYTLMALSAEKAMRSADVKPSEIAGIFTGSNPTGEFLLPNINTIVASLLDIDNFYSGGNGTGCCGGVLALDMANNRLTRDSLNGKKSIYLVFGADQTSKIVKKDSLDEILFSDASGCFVVTNDSNRRWLYEIEKIDNITTPNGSDVLSLGRNDATLVHDGRKVYRFAAESMGKVLKLLGSDKFPEETYLIPHQANLRIIRRLTRDLPTERVYEDGVKNIGNTSPASVMLGLEDVTRRRLNSYETIILTPFGEGLTVAVAILKENPTRQDLPDLWDDIKGRKRYMEVYRKKWKV